jgi:hypothetical protein
VKIVEEPGVEPVFLERSLHRVDRQRHESSIAGP